MSPRNVVVAVGEGASLDLLRAIASLGGRELQRNARDRGRGRRQGRAQRTSSCTLESGDAFHLATWLVELGADANYRAFQFSTGAALARNQIYAALHRRGVGHSTSPARFLMRGRAHATRRCVVDHRRAALHEPRAVQGRARRPGARRVPGQGHRVARRAEDRRQADGAGACCSPRRPSSTPSPSLRSSPTTWSAATARPRARSTRICCSICEARGIPEAAGAGAADPGLRRRGDREDRGRGRARGAVQARRPTWLGVRLDMTADDHDDRCRNRPSRAQDAVALRRRAIRADFPILAAKVYGKPLVYLDNGASAQKPKAGARRHRARLQRGIRQRPSRAALPVATSPPQNFEEARETVRRFLNARVRRRDHLHPQRHRGDQPRRELLWRPGHRRGRRDRALDHGAPLQHRALAFPCASGRARS